MWIYWEKTVFIFIFKTIFHSAENKLNSSQHKRGYNKRCSLLHVKQQSNQNYAPINI